MVPLHDLTAAANTHCGFRVGPLKTQAEMVSSHASSNATATDTATTVSSITKAALDAARAEAERRDSTHGEHDDEEEPSTADVVVARGVTMHDLNQVPDDWLMGMRLALLPDGTLIVDQLASRTVSEVRAEVTTTVRIYAAANTIHGFRSNENRTLSCGLLGMRSPDVVLEQHLDPLEPLRVPRVIVEVVFDRPSCKNIIDMAIGYFQDNATVVKVVTFEFFQPLKSALANGKWEVPALAIAFDRPPASPVRISEIESFGNARITEDNIDKLTSNSGFRNFEPLDRDRANLLRLPALGNVIERVNPFPGLHLHRLMRDPHAFDVSMPEPFGPMSFDLVRIFDAAIVGRFDDEFTAKGLQ